MASTRTVVVEAEGFDVDVDVDADIDVDVDVGISVEEVSLDVFMKEVKVPVDSSDPVFLL